MKYEINLKRFLDFSKGLDLFSGIDHLGEKPGAKKSNRLIYLSMLLMCVLGRSSFLGMDQLGRMEKFKRLFKVDRFRNSRYRHTVVSDSTLIRRLPDMAITELREINYHILQTCLALGLVLPIAIVDGTSWSARLYSCLCFVTRWGDVWMVDFEPIEKRGKELLASQRLLERCCEYLGKGVIELLLADMLYFNERFWELRKTGYVQELLVKYTPMKSKRRWSKDEQVIEPAILIWMLGFSLLCLFRKEYQHHICKTYQQVKETLAFVADVLMIESFARVCLDGI